MSFEVPVAEQLDKEKLYALQEAVLADLQKMGDAQFDSAKLCGGTALARCWMDHRISYDLDFFLPEGFKAADLAGAMKQAGIDYKTKEIVDDSRKANQLHGYVQRDGQSLKVSFIEDAYFGHFPAVQKKFGSLTVRTEEIPGLYHRKLRTVAGHGNSENPESFEGGRQTARDLFDLHVLSSEFKPIKKFMESLPYPFPAEAFDNGLASMPWYELMDELGEINCLKKWESAKNVDVLQNALYGQIGAKTIVESLENGASPAAEIEPSVSKPASVKKPPAP